MTKLFGELSLRLQLLRAKTSTEVHILYEFLLTCWDVVQTLIPPSDLHLGRPQPPCERKLLNLQYARYQSLSK